MRRGFFAKLDYTRPNCSKKLNEEKAFLGLAT
jgi:hypothetical protein